VRIVLITSLGVAIGIAFFFWYTGGIQNVTLVPGEKKIERPLDRYTIDNLGSQGYKESQIVLDEAVATTSAYTAYTFHFFSESKRVTGLVHIPGSPEPAEGFPVIVQLRGYIDRETFNTGDGTKRSAEVFASHGFISLAPDFLGYADSDPPSEDIFEERFQTYTTALTLLTSLKSLPVADESKVGIWGHSNGGQIALTILEVLGQPIPTVLWAPVSKPFPYSILYYTDEASDRGKLLRKRLAEFEEDYDVELYSVPNYIDRITAPIQIHQGSADEAVPQRWSDELDALLTENGKDVTYFTYNGADHNLAGSVGAWNTAMIRSIDFFEERFIAKN
jgi:dipeptidyl aminopeptidase/acylaminoacyl peptidase